MQHLHPSGKRPQTRRTGALTAVIAVAAFAAVILIIWFVGNAIEGPAPEEAHGDLSERFAPSLTLEEGGVAYAYREHELENLLIVGIDKSDINAENRTNRSGGQADFLLVLSIDRQHETVTPLQLDRDTMTPVQIYGVLGNKTGVRVMQLALSHSYGKQEAECTENTVWAVSNLLQNIPIDHVIVLDMNGIVVLNDILGGITVTIEDDLTAVDPAFTKGATLTLHGEQAERYLRARKTVTGSLNTKRLARQRSYMDVALDAAVRKLSASESFAETLYDRLAPHMYTDMSRGLLINTLYKASTFHWNDFQVTGEGSYNVGRSGYMEFRPDEEKLRQQVISIFFNRYN